jgi:hypothetical protein
MHLPEDDLAILKIACSANSFAVDYDFELEVNCLN